MVTFDVETHKLLQQYQDVQKENAALAKRDAELTATISQLRTEKSDLEFALQVPCLMDAP